MKNTGIICLLLYFALFTATQCDDYPCNNVSDRTIPLNVQVNEEKYEYKVGDTLWLNSEFNTKLLLFDSQDTLSLEYGECIANIYLMKLGGTYNTLTGYSDFNFINNIGEINQNNVTDSLARKYNAQILFNCNKDKCEFEVGIIPQKKGSYCLFLHTGRINVQDTSFCPRANKLAGEFKVSSHNRQILKEYDVHFVRFPTIHSSGGLDLSEHDGAFAFKVN